MNGVGIAGRFHFVNDQTFLSIPQEEVEALRRARPLASLPPRPFPAPLDCA